jgi:hypothetical protein
MLGEASQGTRARTAQGEASQRGSLNGPSRQATRHRRNFKKACIMVKRHKVEEIVGVLEFEGRTSEDPEVMKWLAEHKARKGGKIRVSRVARASEWHSARKRT